MEKNKDLTIVIATTVVLFVLDNWVNRDYHNFLFTSLIALGYVFIVADIFSLIPDIGSKGFNNPGSFLVFFFSTSLVLVVFAFISSESSLKARGVIAIFHAILLIIQLILTMGYSPQKIDYYLFITGCEKVVFGLLLSFFSAFFIAIVFQQIHWSICIVGMLLCALDYIYLAKKYKFLPSYVRC